VAARRNLERRREEPPPSPALAAPQVQAGAGRPGTAFGPDSPTPPLPQPSARVVRRPAGGMFLGGCRLLERVGEGGMGEVWKGHHITLEKTVALKILPPYLTGEEEAVGRFIREARAAAKLDHPNIIQVLNLGEQDGMYYIVMQFAVGRPLSDSIREHGVLPIESTLPIVRQVASALGYAHARNFVHRDIKPANLIVNESGAAKIIDFGLTKNILTDANLTTEGMTVGTVNYMSPEQSSGSPLDGRSDLYSLGVTWYEALTGRVPFMAESPWRVLLMHQTDPAPDPRRYRREIPKETAAVVLRLLEKAPADRFQRAEDLIESLG